MAIKKTKNEHKGKLKYPRIMVILAFLAVTYLATATTVITDIQATFVVAASDSSTTSIKQADFVCDGIDDQAEIQAAIDALSRNGGRILLSEGTYHIDGRIILPENVGMKGMGECTILHATAEVITRLSANAGTGVGTIQVTDSLGFEVNDDIAVWDDDSNQGRQITRCKVTDIADSTITFTDYSGGGG